MSGKPRPRGRRPAGSDTRGQILVAARGELAERGFEAASVRAVARRAGVDPALVRHYFVDKADLFAACLVPEGVDPSVVVPLMLLDGVDGLGERLVRTVVEVWDARGGEAFRAAFAALSSSEPQLRVMVEYLGREVFGPVARLLDEHGPARMVVVLTQVMGVLVTRHVLRLEPLASLPPAAIASLVGPAIQLSLTGPAPVPSVGPAWGEPLASRPGTEQNSAHGE